ncbi:MAG: class I tRNA ligase family protein, partial [Nocardioidaceae bacterium]
STFDWGIKVPWDDKQVLYVWIDALLNYITAIGYGDEGDAFDRTWPADVQLVGRDILRFHAVIWPAMLMAAGMPVPRQVFAHGWLLVGGQKMSKSKATAIHPSEIIDTFGSDAYRYYFMKTIAFGSDGSFSWEHMSAVYGSELANGLGNLSSRVAAMVGKYFDGVLPAQGVPSAAERDLAGALEKAARAADEAMDTLEIHEALRAVDAYVSAVNVYVTEQEPWKVAKDDSDAGRARLATILYTAAESLRAIAVLYAPVMPKTARAMWSTLGAADGIGELDVQDIRDAGRWGQLPAGSRITKGAALFPRIEESS